MSNRIGISDTSPAAEAFQIELLRQAGVTRRLALVSSLSRSAISLSRRAIARLHPDANSTELDIIFLSNGYWVIRKFPFLHLNTH